LLNRDMFARFSLSLMQVCIDFRCLRKSDNPVQHGRIYSTSDKIVKKGIRLGLPRGLRRVRKRTRKALYGTVCRSGTAGGAPVGRSGRED
jgi:hypothetical protein